MIKIRSSSLKKLFWIQLFFCCLFCACSINTSENHFGGGSETVALVTGSHSISGKISSSGNVPGNSYAISLYSSTYSPPLDTSVENHTNPITPSTAISVENYTEKTIASIDGHFTFSNLRIGAYNLLVYNADTLKATMIKTIQIDSAATNLYEDTLRETGNFLLTVENVSVKAIAFLNGTPFKSFIGEQNLFVFSRIPQGEYDVKIISGSDLITDSLPDRVFITIEKGKTNFRSIISQ